MFPGRPSVLQRVIPVLGRLSWSVVVVMAYGHDRQKGTYPGRSRRGSAQMCAARDIAKKCRKDGTVVIGPARYDDSG